MGLCGVLRLDGDGLWRRPARVLCVVAVVGLSLVLAPVAGATAPSFTWAGASVGHTESAARWSAAANWAGVTAPVGSQSIATLTFPHLASGGCASPETDTCYVGLNDVSGLSVESLKLDDADEYLLLGERVALSGGLLASPEDSGYAGTFMEMPLELTASQKWSIADRSGGALEENGLVLGGELTGAGSALTVELSNGTLLGLENSTEVGSVTIEGKDASGEHIDNGVTLLEGGELDSSDREQVDLRNIYFEGVGAVGALTADNSTLAVGTSTQPAGGIEASSAKLDSNSGVIFEISGSGTTAQTDYSQLVSSGPVSLNGSLVGVVVVPVSGKCPELVTGRTYSFISTIGGLSGSFDSVPEGAELPLTYANGCDQQTSKHLQVAYHESGGTQTVTATVTETGGLPQPIQHYNPYVAPNAEGATWGLIAAARDIAESQAKEKAEAEARARALAEVSSGEISLADTGIAVQGDGMALVKLDCKGSASCGGKLTFSAQATSKAKGKKKRTITIGTAGFSIPAGKTATVKVKLDAAGRALLGAAHVHLSAHLAIVQSVPTPTRAQIKDVRLLQQRVRNSNSRSSH
jgi:hypothetical protein